MLIKKKGDTKRYFDEKQKKMNERMEGQVCLVSLLLLSLWYRWGSISSGGCLSNVSFTVIRSMMNMISC